MNSMYVQPDGANEVLISPPYLAGGGDPRWIMAALHHVDGWRYNHTPLSPIVHLIRPDQQAGLRLSPDPDEPWWTILHAPTDEHPAWYARFGARTPVEILAAFTDALTAPQPPAGTAVSNPFEPLRQADWHQTDDDWFTSPDGRVHVDHFALRGFDHWLITTALSDDPEDLVWQARLDGNTPTHLITPLARALTDPTPLRRVLGGLPRRVRPHVRTAVPPDSPADLLDPLEQRVQDLSTRGRHQAPSPPRGPLPTPRRTR
ncbi:DUF317 domain-containing protein [Streptomyces sp. NPDC002680]|uniref:DUF317 domain-containing protein n=1 Tax=Streptomyces sp. NPDC002680 TaxID=3364659 RepID=UPI0036A0CD38